MILTLIRRAVGGLVRRVQLARGRRPCLIAVRLKLCPGGARMTVTGNARWWASEEDVRAELSRAWGAARREFRVRYPGHDVALSGPLKLTHAWEYRP